MSLNPLELHATHSYFVSQLLNTASSLVGVTYSRPSDSELGTITFSPNAVGQSANIVLGKCCRLCLELSRASQKAGRSSSGPLRLSYLQFVASKYAWITHITGLIGSKAVVGKQYVLCYTSLLLISSCCQGIEDPEWRSNAEFLNQSSISQSTCTVNVKFTTSNRPTPPSPPPAPTTTPTPSNVCSGAVPCYCQVYCPYCKPVCFCIKK